MTEENTSAIQEFFSAIEQGKPYYITDAGSHGMLPPKFVDTVPENQETNRASMPEIGELLTHSKVHVAPSPLEDISPYTIAIAEFGSVRITGQLREFEKGPEIGQEVDIDLEYVDELEYPVIIFTPV